MQRRAILALTLAVLATVFVVAGEPRARAGEVAVAVASNFVGAAQKLAMVFERDTGHRLVIVSGATGKLYAQIENGAPFEVLLAADDKVPAKLEAEGKAVPGSRFTYALGRLVLWSAKAGYVDPAGAVLTRGGFAHLAIANPKVAPYGAAAIEVLGRLDLLERLRPKLVEGENVAQAREFVASGNAELGLIAQSQVLAAVGLGPGAGQGAGGVGAGPVPAPAQSQPRPSGSIWVVPATLYSPIRQDAVWLRAGEANPAAFAFVRFLRGPAAAAVIRDFGYSLPAGK